MRFWFQKIHPSWMIVATTIGIILGTIMAVVSGRSFAESWVWLITGGVAIVIAIFQPARFMLALALFSGIIFAEYRAGVDLAGRNYLAQIAGQDIEMSGVIAADPDGDDSKTTLKIKHLEIGDGAVSGTVYVQLSKRSDLKRNDKVFLRGKMLDGFGTYAGSLYRPEITKIERPSPGDFLLQIRDQFAAKVREYVPEDEANLGLAYLVGMRSGLSKNLTEKLKVVGLVHIVVASGTHMSILVGFARKIFGKVSRFAGLFFALLLVVGFGSIVGWTASITRAALVSGLSILAWYVGRKFDAWRLILIVMAITLLIEPMYLIDLGWLLSFSSFGGIMLFTPIITEWFYSARKPNLVAETLIATIIATFVCLPVSLYFFGTVSLISLLANLLILPTIPYAMLLVLLTGATSSVPFLANMFSFLTVKLLDFHLFVVNYFSEQRMFFIQIEPNNPLVFLFYIPIAILIICATIKAWKSRVKTSLSNTDENWLLI